MRRYLQHHRTSSPQHVSGEAVGTDVTRGVPGIFLDDVALVNNQVARQVPSCKQPRHKYKPRATLMEPPSGSYTCFEYSTHPPPPQRSCSRPPRQGTSHQGSSLQAQACQCRTASGTPPGPCGGPCSTETSTSARDCTELPHQGQLTRRTARLFQAGRWEPLQSGEGPSVCTARLETRRPTFQAARLLLLQVPVAHTAPSLSCTSPRFADRTLSGNEVRGASNTLCR
jgi:hypothetical protein